MPPTIRPRRGVALLTALLGMVLIAAMIAGAFFASTQEYRNGRNMLVEQRAFAVAEYGLNSEIANWDTGRNLPGGLDVGEIDDIEVYRTSDDTAFVRITRLTDNSFWVTSTGDANIPQPSLRSRRTVNAFVRLAYPTIESKGAIMTAGAIKITGAAVVDGTNKSPLGWDCDEFPGTDLPAIFVPDTSLVNAGTKNIVGGIAEDPAAADSNTYIRYGSETWNSLAAGADIKLTASEANSFGSDILPVADIGDPADLTDDKCVRSKTNWGEPLRTAGSVVACYSRYPIIYADGDLHLKGKGRGQGILLVNGSFEINGDFDFYGLVIVRDQMKKGTGTAHIFGSVMARDAEIYHDSFIAGTQDVSYSKCAVESALRGSAILVRAEQRSWAQLF